VRVTLRDGSIDRGGTIAACITSPTAMRCRQ
jgi:hypothetical protein